MSCTGLRFADNQLFFFSSPQTRPAAAAPHPIESSPGGVVESRDLPSLRGFLFYVQESPSPPFHFPRAPLFLAIFQFFSS